MKHLMNTKTEKLTRRGFAFLLALVLTTSAFVPGLTARATEGETPTLESLEPLKDYETAVDLLKDLDTLARELTKDNTKDEIKAVYDAVVTAQADAEELTGDDALTEEEKEKIAAQAAVILTFLEEERGYQPEEEEPDQQSDDPVCTCPEGTEGHIEGCDLYEAPKCTCPEGTEGHIEGCDLYEAPKCTCPEGTEGHVEGCTLYVAPCEVCGETDTHKADCATLCTCPEGTEGHVEGCVLYVAPCEVCGETGTHKADCATLCTCPEGTEGHLAECPLYICADCGLNNCICGLESAYLLDGAVIYKDYNNTEDTKTITGWNTAVKIQSSVTAEDGTVWYQFVYSNVLKELLNGYHYVKAADTTTLKCTCTPVEGEHAEDCPLYVEPTPYEKAMADLTALEEEAKTLADDLDKDTEDYIEKLTEKCRNLEDRLFEVITEIAILWEENTITDDEYYAAEEKAMEIIQYLLDTYRYENREISLYATAAAKDTDKETSNANGAIKFQLFNYDTDINYTADGGTTLRPIATYFNFRDGTNYKDVFPQTDYDKDGFPKNHATVEHVLDANGYPVLDLTRYADSTDHTNALPNVAESIRKLDYLFKSGDHAVKAYTPTNSILQKNGTTYHYNSAENAVDYDIANDMFRVRNYLERTQTTSGYPGYSDFMPFVYTDGVSIGNTTVSEQAIPYHISNTYNGTVPVDYWFGMVMEVDFYMPKDGQVNGEDMTFKFSGDDDVWVFIDNVLVLDLGGTHGTVNGSINFATGEVQQYLSWGNANSNLKDDGTDPRATGSDTSFPTTLWDCFEAAGPDYEPSADAYGESWNDSNVTFADYTKHTLKFFYMERGAGVANCMLDFNLTTLPDGGASVLKEMSTDSVYTDVTDNDTYQFQLLQQSGSSWVPVANKAYTVDGVSAGNTDTEGKFSLAPNKMAVFAGLTTSDHGKKYRVKELSDTNSEIRELKYTGNADSTKWSVNQTEGYVEFTVLPDDAVNKISHMNSFTNALRTTDFSVYKTVTGNLGDRSKVFAFTATLYTKENGTQIPFPAPEQSETFYTVDSDGVAHFTLRHDQHYTFDDVPLGAYVVINETADGYSAKNALDPADVADEAAYNSGTQLTFVTDLTENNHKAYFINEKTVTIDTGISLDSIPYIVILVGVAAVVGFLFLRKRRVED